MDHILERGWNLYDDNCVDLESVTPTKITAEVFGNTDNYEVEITRKEGKIKSLYCFCPHADEGNNCKHMAAVLYTVDDEEEIELSSDDESDILELVESLSISQLKTFLIDIVLENADYRNRLKAAYGNLNEDDIKHLYQKVDGAIRKAADRDGYITYGSTQDFENSMDKILEEDIQMLLDHGALVSAFNLSTYIFLNLEDLDIDDSNGTTGSIAYSVVEVWGRILKQADDDMKKQMFQWVYGQLTQGTWNYLDEQLQEFLFDHFNSYNYLQLKLQLCDDMLEKVSTKSDNWSKDYQSSLWIRIKLDCLLNLDTPFEEILLFCKQHWYVSEVRKFLADYHLEEGNIHEAIAIYEDSIQLEKDKPGLIRGYRMTLKSLYQKVNLHEKYKETLWELVLDLPKDMELYKELKSLYTVSQWQEKREVIFHKHPRLPDLYKYEGLYDRLLNVVLQYSDASNIYDYEDCLKNLYPNELLDKYEEIARRKSQPVTGRETYRDISQILRHMFTIKGGAKKAQNLQQEFLNLYKKRPAMVDELKKAFD